jgi:hypothetical protein
VAGPDELARIVIEMREIDDVERLHIIEVGQLARVVAAMRSC